MMFISKLTILLAIIVFTTGCPSPESVEPCTCDNNELTCRSKDLSLEQMTKQMKLEKLPTISKKLKLTEMKLRTLKLHLLNNIMFRTLQVSHCELDGITNEDFANEKSLRAIDIVASIDEKKADFKLNIHNLQSVNKINFYHNYIKRIPNDWFRKGMPGLKHLSFSGNEVEYIEDEAFSHLVNLNGLNLSKNRLRFIKRSMLPSPGHRLESLNLSDNDLTALPIDLFSGLISLNRIALRKNKIQHLPEETWKPIWFQLKILYLSGNPLDCSADLKWIAKLSSPILTGRCAAFKGKKRMQLVDFIKELRDNQALPS